jgi:hypothetical protein
VAQAWHLVVQGVEGAGQVVVGVGAAGESEDALLESLDGAPGDVGFAEISERAGKEIVLLLQGCAGFGDRFNECGKILGAKEVGVGAAQAEVGFDEFDFAEDMDFTGACGLIEEVGEVEEVKQSGEGAFRSRGAFGHEREAAGLLAETAHDEACVAERHPRDDDALDSARFAHDLGLDRINKINRMEGAGTSCFTRALHQSR